MLQQLTVYNIPLPVELISKLEINCVLKQMKLYERVKDENSSEQNNKKQRDNFKLLCHIIDYPDFKDIPLMNFQNLLDQIEDTSQFCKVCDKLLDKGFYAHIFPNFDKLDKEFQKNFVSAFLASFQGMKQYTTNDQEKLLKLLSWDQLSKIDEDTIIELLASQEKLFI